MWTWFPSGMGGVGGMGWGWLMEEGSCALCFFEVEMEEMVMC